MVSPRRGGVASIAASLACGRGRPCCLLGVDCDEVSRWSGVEDTDVHPRASETVRHLGVGSSCHSCNRCAQLAARSCVTVVGAGRAVDSCEDAGEAGLADAAHASRQVVLCRLAPALPPLVPIPVPSLLPLVAVPVGDVGLEVPPAEVGSSAAIVPIPILREKIYCFFIFFKNMIAFIQQGMSRVWLKEFSVMCLITSAGNRH